MADASNRKRPSGITWRWLHLVGVVSLVLTATPGILAQEASQEALDSDARAGTNTAKRPAADWIVTTDGARIELDGPWRLEGGRVLFRTKAGTLSVLRREAVDFERSRVPAPAPTQRVLEPPKTAASPVLVLEDKDVAAYAGPDTPGSSEGAPRNPPQATAGATPDAPAAPGASARRAAPSGLEVVSWKPFEGDSQEGMTLYGTLKNSSRRAQRGLEVTVILLDETGSPMATRPAQMTRPAVDAGQTVNFRVTFPDSVAYDTIEFEIAAE